MNIDDVKCDIFPLYSINHATLSTKLDEDTKKIYLETISEVLGYMNIHNRTLKIKLYFLPKNATFVHPDCDWGESYWN